MTSSATTEPALDLSAIVEAAAKAFYESGAPSALLSWEDAPALVKHDFREATLPAVTATLRALEPLVGAMGAKAAELDKRVTGEGAFDKYPSQAHRAVGYRDATNYWAKQLRALMPANPATTDEVS